jgi:hypothetical protein
MRYLIKSIVIIAAILAVGAYIGYYLAALALEARHG